MKFSMIRTQDAFACYLGHKLQVKSQTFKKGIKLRHEDINLLHDGGIDEIYAGRLEEDELDENEAAAFLSHLFKGNFRLSFATTGRVNFYADNNGLFEVDRCAVDSFNGLDSAITLATINPQSPIYDDEMVATLKIIPMAVKRTTIELAADYLKNHQLFKCVSFLPFNVTLFETILPHTKPSIIKKTEDSLQQRLALSASCLSHVEIINHECEALAHALKKAISTASLNNPLFIIYGASAVVDENDVIPAAIRLAGGSVTRIGMPVEPGNLIVFGQIGDIIVIGAPGCSRSIAANGLDFILNHVLTGQSLTSLQISKTGVGGLLNGQKARMRAQEKIENNELGIAAIILAAGRSTRLKDPSLHKLLAKIDGETLIHKVARAAKESRCNEIKLVSGCRSEEIIAAISDLDIDTIFNPAFESGMASSIITGIRATNPSVTNGFLILLGDMPGLTAVMINQLIAAFKAHDGQAIIRAVFNGKRGNPVIIPAALRSELLQLQGDVGARALIEKAQINVVDVDIGEAAHIDVDTLEAVAMVGAVFDD